MFKEGPEHKLMIYTSAFDKEVRVVFEFRCGCMYMYVTRFQGQPTMYEFAPTVVFLTALKH